ncbi:MAG: type II secretion system major pseudopilin GspG [Euryhalocaulis sp.]|uniref:type II secretion system major pseudopilin GspG n=1 Tax=Euryhalocaulis sp. TaxID=2744307 RepID=UPI00182CC093|nr:type II secretion system major pseudopilin GspG [Euryhalocaulis sp.]MBA4801706.1 type II secretion system major pseudopilin GspG [Euryhalocaulis sp.]
MEKLIKTIKKKRDGEAGFTLTELMVVIFIIGLLATVVLINVLPSSDQARVEKARADIRLLEQALELYRMDMLVYPSTEQGLEALVEVPDGVERAANYREGGYIRRLPNDPWDSPYQYVFPGEHGPYDLYTTGADGQLDGEGLNADIGNWN